MREFQIDILEMRTIMEDGKRLGYFKYVPQDEIAALDFLRLQVETLFQKRRQHELEGDIILGRQRNR